MNWLLFVWRFRVRRRRAWRWVKQLFCLRHKWDKWISWGGWHEFCTKCGKTRNFHHWNDADLKPKI